MAFKDQISGDLAQVFLDTNSFAESITYTPSGESGSAVTAIVFRDVISEEVEDGRGIVRDIRADVLIDLADVSAPSTAGDTVTFDSKTWAVIKVDEDGPSNSAMLTVWRQEVVEKSQSGHRQSIG